MAVTNILTVLWLVGGVTEPQPMVAVRWTVAGRELADVPLSTANCALGVRRRTLEHGQLWTAGPCHGLLVMEGVMSETWI